MNFRICKSCNVRKLLKYFVFRRDVPSKRKYICKECLRVSSLAWKRANKEKVNKSNRKRYHKNIERYKAKSLQWQKENKAICNEKARKWRLNNPDKYREITKRYERNHLEYICFKAALRRARKLMATPFWVDLHKIKSIYEKSRQITKKTGIKYNVDHMIPLTNSKVCGLHVPWNLRIIPAKKNREKYNKLEVLVK